MLKSNRAGKCVVYLADLNYVRFGREWTIIPFPLNVAYIAGFLQRMRPGVFDVRIFKNPASFLDAVAQAPPDIAAFSNYIWNRNLALACARHVKSLHPSCITVMGGPNANFNDPVWLEAFVRKHPQVDFHIEGEGEVKLYNLAVCALEHQGDMDAIRRANPAGVAFLDREHNRLVSNALCSPAAWSSLEGLGLDTRAGRLLSLDEIPSPYLTGLLDEFLADPNYCPIIETNRGCPYECTFCNWGDMGKSKSSMFGRDRIIEELQYIAARNVSKTPYLYIGDANFGLFERDVEFARLLRDLKDAHGFPQNVYLYYAKNSSEKVVRIAEILKGMTRVNLSRQTQNPDVLNLIKRSNIAVDTFSRLVDLAKELGVESFVELIYGLPGESRDSFFAGLKSVMAQNVDGLHLFPAMLLDGSEMGSRASREQFGLHGEFRRIDGSAGRYGPVAAMEFEEIVTETAAMSRDDYFEIRLFHFFQTLVLDTKLYRDIEALIGVTPLFDVLQQIIARRASAPPAVKALIDEFMTAAKAEFVIPPDDFDAAEVEACEASLVKLNPLFICKLLYDSGVRAAFHAYLKTLLLDIGAATEQEIDTVLRHIDESIYPFDGSTSKTVGSRRYTKRVTFQNFLDQMPADMPLAAKVYEVVLHHTHQIVRTTVSWTTEGGADADVEQAILIGPVAGAERQIENEGGWLY